MTDKSKPDKRTRLTPVEDMLQAAEKNGWLVDRTGTQMTFMCPDVLLGKFMEPQILHCTEDENGYLAGDPKLHTVETFANVQTGESTYNITGGAAFRAVKNTYHPLRSLPFFNAVMAAGRNDRELCEPHGIPHSALRMPRLRGYMTWKEADKFSVKLLSRHPAEIWGADAWIRTVEEGWL